ncbi:MAG TPA: hypothetical protein QF802_03250, partial [Candidatus Thalassarchaeaceae archaeon]|nr:hypothetical protein [Candidatus Thalassarchaeaceae archaeon]
MAEQDNSPPIFGEGWNPSVHLEFDRPLKVAEARTKMMQQVAQQLDGHLRVFAFIWDEMTSEIEQWDGEEFHAFSSELVTEIVANLGRRGSEKLTSDIATEEVIPRRSGALHLERRTARF